MKKLAYLFYCFLIAATVVNATEYETIPIDDNYYDWDRSLLRYIPYNRRNDIDNSVHLGRTRLGQGIFRLLSGGRDAELRCEFPSHDLVSNVVWERVTDPTGRAFSMRPYYLAEYGNRHDFLLTGRGSYYNGRTAVLQRSEGASLYLRDVMPADAGIYRCLASRRVPQSVGRWSQAVETIFQDIYFFPADVHYDY